MKIGVVTEVSTFLVITQVSSGIFSSLANICTFMLRWQGSLSAKAKMQAWVTVMIGVSPSFRVGVSFREILLCLIRVLVVY